MSARPFSSRYSVITAGNDLWHVYDNVLLRQFTPEPCSWSDARKLAEHMEQSHERSRQQIDDPDFYDGFDEHRSGRDRAWSVGDYQQSASRRV